MFGDLRINGIYIHTSDMKKDGYQVRDANGNLITKEYEAPSTWEKWKFKLKYGYEMNTQTIITSYYCFSKYEPDHVFHGAILGDGIAVARMMKKSLDYNGKQEINFEYGKFYWEKNNILTELNSVDGGKALLEERSDTRDLNTISKKMYAFVDWEYLH